ncbi:Druantia anti-phage system protein DruA [Geobacillus thermodenitrificans]|uniref:Druantia anti-phage system protein DruA n=1 Tax=Geobacillus thermodenitrificans TaxID=33940 RepID=UPI003D24BB0F
MVNRLELKNELLNLRKLSQKEQKELQNKKYDAEFINPCDELNPENIYPELILVDSKSPYWKEWKAIEEHVASFEFRRSPGRNCYFLVKNKYNNKNLGVIDVGADFLSLGVRDEYIGWNKEQRKLLNRNIANISICVPTRNFGYNLSGGKLLALLAISNEVASVWKERYGDDLVGVTVTSLYGKGSQYNRLKHFKYLGKTKGQGTCQIPDSLYRKCRELVEEIEGEIPGGCFTKGKNSRINIIRRACKYLDLDPSIITTHGRQRGVYWCDRGNTKEFLTQQTNVFIEKEGLDIDNLLKYWKETWAYRRLKNLNINIHNKQNIIIH